jgi:hypothetical protein
MAYIINDYGSSNVRLTIQDGIVDNSTSLNLIGKNVSNFGALQNENFLYLLENFANSSSPANPIPGQLWYNVSTETLSYYNSNDWVGLNVLNTNQSTVQTDSLYFDNANGKLYVSNGVDLILVGPESITGFGTTKLSSTTLIDTHYPPITHPVIKIIVDGETVGVISTNSFFVDSGNSIAGISYVERGINLKYSTTNDFPLIGRSHYSNLATTATNLFAGAAGSLPYQSSYGNTTYLGIGSAGTLLMSTGSVPSWKSVTNLSVNTATNIAGGASGSIVVQSSSGASSFVSLGTQHYILSAGLTTPVWIDPNTLSVTSASNSVYAGTSTFSSVAFTSTYAATVPWSGVTGTPVNIAGYGILDAITNDNIALQSVSYADRSLTSTMATNQLGMPPSVSESTTGIVYGHWTLSTGSTFYATYADLAEKYLPDEDYEPGTVLSFGGSKEVTISTIPADTSVAGVVSTNPAYGMNQALEGGVYIALAGRVPCKVIGPVKQGDLLVTSNIPGVATSISNINFGNPKTGTIIGKAIYYYNDTGEVGVIEVMVKSS